MGEQELQAQASRIMYLIAIMYLIDYGMSAGSYNSSNDLDWVNNVLDQAQVLICYPNYQKWNILAS